MSEIKDKLKQWVISTSAIVKESDELEAEIRGLTMKRDAVVNEIKQLQDTRLKDAQSLQSKKSDFLKYEDETRTKLELEKSKLEALVSEANEKIAIADEKTNNANTKMEEANRVKVEGEFMRKQYEAKIAKLKDFVGNN